jgi:hypothetical protein
MSTANLVFETAADCLLDYTNLLVQPIATKRQHLFILRDGRRLPLDSTHLAGLQQNDSTSYLA